MCIVCIAVQHAMHEGMCNMRLQLHLTFTLDAELVSCHAGTHVTGHRCQTQILIFSMMTYNMMILYMLLLGRDGVFGMTRSCAKLLSRCAKDILDHLVSEAPASCCLPCSGS